MIARYLIYGVLALFAVSSITITVVPTLRSKAKAWLSTSERKILAKAQGRLTLQGPDITVLKLLQDNEMFIEVYNNNPEHSDLALIARIKLPEVHDAFFTFQGNATNLALGDLDSDGTLEILTPTFDKDMVARLNIYKYNSETQSFDRMNSENRL